MKRSNVVPALVILGVLALGAGDAAGQVQFSVEPRVGVTFPTGDLSSAGAEAGLALGGELMMTFHRNLTAYVGLQRHQFSCDADCDLGRNPRSSGLGAGLKYIFPSPPDALIWGRAGFLAHQLSADNGAGDRNLGFEGSAGIDMPIRPRLYLTPHIGVLTHDAGAGFRATWVNFGVGLHYHLN